MARLIITVRPPGQKQTVFCFCCSFFEDDFLPKSQAREKSVKCQNCLKEYWQKSSQREREKEKGNVSDWERVFEIEREREREKERGTRKYFCKYITQARFFNLVSVSKKLTSSLQTRNKKLFSIKETWNKILFIRRAFTTRSPQKYTVKLGQNKKGKRSKSLNLGTFN